MIYVFAPTFPTTAIDTSIYRVGKTLGEVGRIFSEYRRRVHTSTRMQGKQGLLYVTSIK